MFGPTYTVLFDSNVLFSGTLRHLIMYLATRRVFRARWSEDIHREWMAAVRARYPDVPREYIDETRRLMDEHAEESLVVGYESLIESVDLPDPDDRHVLAAAIRTRAHLIVTHNIRHFPASTVSDEYDIDVQDPDTFFTHQLDLFPTSFLDAARRHRKQPQRPPRSVDAYLEALRRAGLTETVLRLEACRERL